MPVREVSRAAFFLLQADSNVYINFRICSRFKFLKYYNALEIVGVQMVGKCA